MKKMKLLALLLVCAILFQTILPGLTISAAAETAAEGELTFNGGYPYGKDMTSSSVTLVAPIEGSGSVQWYHSSSKNGEYTLISGANSKEYKPNLNDKDCFPDVPSRVNDGTGNMVAVNKDSLFKAYENGTLTKEQSEYCPLNWFRCKVNSVWSKPVQLVQAVKCSCMYEKCPGGTVSPGTGQITGIRHVHSVETTREKLYQISAINVRTTTPENEAASSVNTWWYISNGYSAYTVYPKAPDGKGGPYQAFDVLGRYKHRSARRSYYYQWLSESNANMSFDNNKYEELRMGFDDNDVYHKRVLVNVKLPASQNKLALLFRPKLGEWKMYYKDGNPYQAYQSGVVSAICNNKTSWPSGGATPQDLTGIQMIGSESTYSGIYLDTPAWNITFEDDWKPSSFWLGTDEDKMYEESYVYDGYRYDPEKYAFDYNTKPYTGNQSTETTGTITGKGKVVNSVQSKFSLDIYKVIGSVAVPPVVAAAWTGTAGRTVTFGVAAGTITDTNAAIMKPSKCPVYIGGRPVTDRSTIDTGVADGYVYDGEPIELWKDRVTVKTANEYVFTDEEVKNLLDVETDLDFSFYEAEGTLDKKEVKVYPGEKLDFVPIDSRDYFLIVSVPDDNPYFTSKLPTAKSNQGQYYFDIFAKKIPVYDVVAKDKFYDGKTTIEWDWHDIKWGDETEAHKVYERDHVNTWFLTEIQAEYEDPAVGNGKKIVGLMSADGKKREDINIIHWSGSDRDPNYKDDIQWKNYAPYLAPDPTGNILPVPAGTADALAPPEAEVLAPTSITLKGFPGGGTVEYAMKVPDPNWTDDQKATELATAPSDGWKTTPEFTGLTKGSEYYFYMRITGHPGFEDNMVTSKGAAISTSNEPLKVGFKSIVRSRNYDGTSVAPNPEFNINSSIPTTTCPVEVLEFTWRQKIYDLETKEYKYVALDSPPKNYGTYEVNVAIKAENASDYAITGKTTFSFNIYRKMINRISPSLFSAEDRAYDGTNKVSTLHYNEAELRAAIEREMVGGDTTAGMDVAAAGTFSEWSKYPNTIPGEQAYENKPYSVTILLSGPGSENYEFPFPVSGLTATVNKAVRFISASEDITNNGGGSITVGLPEFGGEDDTAGTDGDIAYAISLTDDCPAEDSPLWQNSPTFTGLEGNATQYYIFARITGGTNYEDAYSDSVNYISGAPHEHSWDTANWEHNETSHWHKCLASDCFITDNAQKDGYAEHSFGPWTVDPADGSRVRSCTVCGHEQSEASAHTHNWDKANWEKNETSHWHECLASDCFISDNAQKDGYAEHSFGPWTVDPAGGSRVRSCTVCGHEQSEASAHTHNWDKANWEKNDTSHWHECLTPDCFITDNAQKDGYAEHSFGPWTVDPADGSRVRSCTVCGYEQSEASTHAHNWDKASWEKNETSHWHECLAPDCFITDNARKDGYGVHSFGGWIENPDDDSKSRSCTVCGYEERALRPVGQISLGTLTWSRQYHNNPEPVISNLETPILMTSAVSRGVGVELVSMEYICSGEAKNPEEFDRNLWEKDPNQSITSSARAGEVQIPEELFSGAYVYLRTMDSAGNVHYASTPKLVFDKEPPKIMTVNPKSEVTSGKTYCTSRTVTVSDNRELASVTLDGKPSKIVSGTASLWLRTGEHTIVAVDTAGNRTAVSIKINNGHVNQEWSIPASCEGIGITVTTCTVCGYTSTTSTSSTGHTWDTKYTVDLEPTCTEPGMESLHCTKCGAINTEEGGHREIPAKGHTIDENNWEHGASRHWQVCTVCGMRFNENSHQGSGHWISAKGRSRMESEATVEHMDCAVCGALVSQRLRPQVEANDPNLYGSVEKQTEVKPGAPEAVWNNSLQEVMTAAELVKDDLTNEGGNAVSHKLVLSVSPFEGNEKITGQTEIEEKAKELTNDATFLYMDVSLIKHTYVESSAEQAEIEETTQKITETKNEIEVTLIIPEELRTPPEGMKRTFYLLYAHENADKTIDSGKLEAIAENGALTFRSNRFSTYAIAYVDTLECAEPPVTSPPSSKPSGPSIPILPPSPSPSPDLSPSPSPDLSPSPSPDPSPSPSPDPSPSPSPEPSPDPAVDHIDYIQGYKGEFRPNAYMSRAEASQIFYTLLADTPETWHDFDDVPESAWYREPVSALAGMGMVKGVGRNLFEPMRSVTRAEFASIAVRFMKLPVTGKASSFPDVPKNAWYSGTIAACESAGWIVGYPDGLFHPGDPITRAQAVTIVNRMLKRSADEQALAGWEMPFSDVHRTHWAYADILEAAIAHKAWLKPDGSETWEHPTNHR